MLSTPMDVAQANADGVHLEAEDDIAAEEVDTALERSGFEPLVPPPTARPAPKNYPSAD
jgi:hypothetical protein